MEGKQSNGVSMADINMFLAVHSSEFDLLQHRAEFIALLSKFNRMNSNPVNSPHLATPGTDKLFHLAGLVFQTGIKKDDDLIILILEALKINFRKSGNRALMREEFVKELVSMLKLCFTYDNMKGVTEVVFCLFNLCYEKVNCEWVLDAHGLEPLLTILGASRYSSRAQESAAGTVHHLCFQLEGKRRLLELDGIPTIIDVLSSTNSAMTQLRCAGILHNITMLSASIHQIRSLDGITLLVDLLASEDLTLCASVAGTLQNMAREMKSRSLLLAGDAVCLLARLLFSPDVNAQSKAASALLNILGPRATEEDEMNELRTALADCIVVGVLNSVLFQAKDDKFTHETHPTLESFEQVWVHRYTEQPSQQHQHQHQLNNNKSSNPSTPAPYEFDPQDWAKHA